MKTNSSSLSPKGEKRMKENMIISFSLTITIDVYFSALGIQVFILIFYPFCVRYFVDSLFLILYFTFDEKCTSYHWKRLYVYFSNKKTNLLRNGTFVWYVDCLSCGVMYELLVLMHIVKFHFTKQHIRNL